MEEVSIGGIAQRKCLLVETRDRRRNRALKPWWDWHRWRRGALLPAAPELEHSSLGFRNEGRWNSVF